MKQNSLFPTNSFGFFFCEYLKILEHDTGGFISDKKLDGFQEFGELIVDSFHTSRLTGEREREGGGKNCEFLRIGRGEK